MGLDNGFILTNKKTKTKLELGYFRNFYELDRWVRENGISPEIDRNFCYDFILNKEILKKLLEEITPIAEKLLKFGDNKVSYYDSYGYPQEFIETFYREYFNPASSDSAFAGEKLIDLYYKVKTMYDLYDINDNMDEDWILTFYSSF